MLELEEFKQVVKNTPLFAIDLVVVNQHNQILVGERKNAPAKGFWFVPGGRVYKNETLEEAFLRISEGELGLTIPREKAVFLGLFDHFYDDSFFSSDISTHYINAAHWVSIDSECLNLPDSQHNRYRWLSFDQIEGDQQVHRFSKVFLENLRIQLA